MLDLAEARKLITDARKEIPRGFSGVTAAKLQLAQMELQCAILEQLRSNGGGKWQKK